MLEKDKRETYQHEFEAELKEAYGDKYTSKQIMEHLFGDYDGWKNGTFTLHTYKDKPKQTLFNRFNLLWVYPIFLLIVFPVLWILTGQWGTERGSKLGKVLEWLVKFD